MPDSPTFPRKMDGSIGDIDVNVLYDSLLGMASLQ
jgi:hypothetical protein